MHSTSVYGPELLILKGTGGKAPETDHRELALARYQYVIWCVSE